MRKLLLLTYNAILCNDTKVLEDGSLAGDPTETALTEMAFGFKYALDKNKTKLSLIFSLFS